MLVFLNQVTDKTLRVILNLVNDVIKYVLNKKVYKGEGLMLEDVDQSQSRNDIVIDNSRNTNVNILNESTPTSSKVYSPFSTNMTHRSQIRMTAGH